MGFIIRTNLRRNPKLGSQHSSLRVMDYNGKVRELGIFKDPEFYAKQRYGAIIKAEIALYGKVLTR